MNKILLSIIVPVFQVQDYITDCLDSIISSIAKNESVEIICLDDGSTDNSGSVCSDYANKYSFIKYLKKNNEGVSKTRNLGVELAAGDYIAFVDSDDLVHPEYIPAALAVIKERTFDLCFFEYEDLPQKQNNFSPKRSNRSALFTNKDTGRMVYNRMLRSSIHLSSVFATIYRKCFLIKNNISFNANWTSSEDVDFINSCLSVAEDVAYKNQTSIIYRRYREGSATNSMNNEKVICDLQVRVKWYEYALKEHIGKINYYPNEFVDLMLVANMKQPGGKSILEYLKKHRYILDEATSKKALLFKRLSAVFGVRLGFLITKTIVNAMRKRD